MNRKWKWAGVALSLMAVLATIINLALSSTGLPDEARHAFVRAAVLAAGLAVVGVLFAVVVHLSAAGKSKEEARITAIEMIPPGLIVTGPLAIANGIAWWNVSQTVPGIGWGVFQMALGAILLRKPQYLTSTWGTRVSESQQTSKAVATHPRTLTLAMIGSTLTPLILGIIFTATGIVLLTSGLALLLVLASVLLILGVIFIAVSSFATRRGLMSDPHLPEASTALALYVAVEFLAGALLAYMGIGNLPPFNSEGPVWFPAAFAAFGLLLVTDSLLIYRGGFKQDLGKKERGLVPVPKPPN